MLPTELTSCQEHGMHILRGFSIVQIPANRAIDKKPNFTYCDLHDVTLGSPAIFPKEEKTLKEGQRGNIKTRGFPSPSHDGFGFLCKRFELPTGKNRLSGAGHIHFEVFFHWGTS